MKVLLGMCFLAHRTGAEIFCRDVALALNRRGHSAIVYAPIMGDMVEPLRKQSIACTTDLGSIGETPDIIIGNTQVETVLSLARFPGVPAISICHDRVAHHGWLPRFSRIRAYVAVDANCAERLTMEHGIAPSQVRIVSNGIDLRRFRPRAPLPERPRVAAIFSNYATEGAETETVRRACAAEGITLEVIGSGAGSQVRDPEEILHKYDLVFAKARCAMEAMAVGCAVVVLNEGFGMAGMVNSVNVAEWHSWNFGRRLLVRHQIEEARVRDAIRAYAAEDAKLVSTYIREHASLEATVTALESLAREVLSADVERIPPERENQEFAQYVHDFLLAPDRIQFAVQMGELQQRLHQAQRHAHQLHQEVSRVRADAQRAEADAKAALSAIQGEVQRMRTEAEKARSVAHGELSKLQRKLAALRGSYSWRITAPIRWLRKRLRSRLQRRSAA